YTQEEGIDYDEVFAPVARIEAIRLFLAYASFMGFIVYQINVKSAFLYGTIEEEVYVCQPPGFEDPQFPNKVYKVYVDAIIFGSTKKSLCVKFESLMHKKFQMSSIGELTFSLGLQVMQRDDGIFISQDKYVADILKKFDFATMKTTSTPIETNKALLKDEEAEDVDVHLYRSMIGSLMYLIASRPDIMFAVCACASVYARASLDRKSTIGGCQFLGKRLISWQCKKQTIVANSTTEAEYVAAANYYLKFVDQHNMVSCLEKSEGNADFHKIVDFLTASFVYYALTITLAEPFNDVYQTPAHTKKVFTNMKRKGKVFSGRVTPLFASMLAPPVVEGEADEAVFKEWDDRVVRATTTAASLDATQASGNISKTQSTTMSNDPLSQEIGSGDRPRCQEAMGGVIAQTRSERSSKHSYDSPLLGGNTPGSDEERIEQDDLMDFVPPTPHDSPLSGGHTPGSDEGRPNINELMAICTNLSNRVLALEQSKTAQDLVIRKLKKKVRKLEKKLRARTPGMKLFKIGTSKRKGIWFVEYVSKRGGTVTRQNQWFGFNNASIDVVLLDLQMFNAADLLQVMLGIFLKDEMMDYCLIHLWLFREYKTKNTLGWEIAQILHEEEKAELERMQRERATQEKESNAALIAKFDNVQARMEADALLAKLYEKEQKWIKDFIPMDSKEGGKKAASSKKRPRAEPDEESVKRQKIGETSVEEVIVEKPYGQISNIRLGRFTSKDIQEDDLVKLWDLVKKRFSITEPIDDKEKELWVDLKRLFKPDNDDIMWKLQRYMHDPLVWRIYDTCGVHHVSSVRGHDYFMLV
ncbi:putative ribonuclease H-like domain-containing protein, partial [Tanacetum coccineum]